MKVSPILSNFKYQSIPLEAPEEMQLWRSLGLSLEDSFQSTEPLNSKRMYLYCSWYFVIAATGNQHTGFSTNDLVVYPGKGNIHFLFQDTLQNPTLSFYVKSSSHPPETENFSVFAYVLWSCHFCEILAKYTVAFPSVCVCWVLSPKKITRHVFGGMSNTTLKSSFHHTIWGYVWYQHDLSLVMFTLVSGLWWSL